jgi:hypothetical protein
VCLGGSEFSHLCSHLGERLPRVLPPGFDAGGGGPPFVVLTVINGILTIREIPGLLFPRFHIHRPPWTQLTRSTHPWAHKRFTHFSTMVKTLRRMTWPFLHRLFTSSLLPVQASPAIPGLIAPTMFLQIPNVRFSCFSKPVSTRWLSIKIP